MNLNYDGKTAIITGSSQGIGLAIARSLLNEGASVWLTGRNTEALESAALGCINSRERIHSFPGDMADADTLEKLAASILQHNGYLDALICNIGSGKSVPPLSEDAQEWQRMLDINLLSAVAAVQALLPILRLGVKQHGQASITFISSICGDEALGCPIAYSSAKSALNSYAKNIARPLAAQGIRVNTVSPGNIIFPGSTWETKIKQNPKAVDAMLEREVPLGRLGTAMEVADIVTFLASERAAFVTGADWIVDGGQTRNI